MKKKRDGTKLAKGRKKNKNREWMRVDESG